MPVFFRGVLVELDVTSTGLFSICAGFSFPVCCVEVSSAVLCLLCCVVFNCVALP